MDVTTTTDVDATIMYLEETATAGFGLSFCSPAAADVTVPVYSATTDVETTVTMITDAATGSGLSFSSSSVADVATITVAANS